MIQVVVCKDIVSGHPLIKFESRFIHWKRRELPYMVISKIVD